MTNKINPFKLVEKIGVALVYALYGLVLLFALFVLTMSFISAGWGWWTLLAVPGAVVVLLFIAILLGLIGHGFDTLYIKWTRAKSDWEYKNRKASK